VHTKALTKAKVAKIAAAEAKKAIDAAAPGLSVAHATSADSSASATNATNANNANNAHAVDGVSQETLTIGRSDFDNSCDPSSTTSVDCVDVALDLPRSARVYMNANAGFYTGVGGAAGACHLEVDDATSAIPHAAGSHTFELSCSETLGNIAYDGELISAVMIGSA
jgi:hypothetical protein